MMEGLEVGQKISQGISQGIIEQGRLFVWGVASGAVLSFFYDLLRLWRRLIFHGQIWMAIEDVVFFLVSAIVGFQLLYPLSLGQLRVFLVLSIVVGALLYHKLLGIHFIRGGTKLIRSVKKALHGVFLKLPKHPKEAASDSFLRCKKKQQKSHKIPIEK